MQAAGSSVAERTNYTHDQNTALLTWETDPNNITTCYGYDPLGRPTLGMTVTGGSCPNNAGSSFASTSTTDEDSNRRSIIRKDLNTPGDGAWVTVTSYDPLGRVALTRELESSPQGVDDDSAGIKVQTRYLYSGANQYRLVSNPYRSTSSTSASTEGTMGWIVTKLDQDGRVVSTQSFDGSGLPFPWGNNGNVSGTVTTAYNAQATTVTDAAGKQRQMNSDALGRLTNVVEDPGGLNFSTSYSYDALDNLTSATQGTSCPNSCESRLFTYDSLKRLTQAINPESGTTTYGYDGDGNLTTKTDARGNTVNYAYDALNRLLQKTYANNAANVVWTPTVNYTYDQGGAYSIGHLTQVLASGHSVTNYGPFDPLGHVLNSAQSTANTLYSFTYKYNLVGELTSETYPSGRKVVTNYDSADRLTQVTGTLNGQPTNYVSAVSYAPQGAPSAFRYGNGVSRANSFNSRLQPQESTDTVAGQPNWALDLQYRWGDNGTQTLNNNGNLRGELIQTWNGPSFSTALNCWEAFTYDGVNRLQTMRDNCGTNERDFAYDQFGNMWVSGNTGFNASGTMPVANVYNTANRLNNTHWVHPAAHTYWPCFASYSAHSSTDERDHSW